MRPLFLLLALAAAAAPAVAQQPASPSATASAAQRAQPASPPARPPADGGFDYNPEGRRDPFVSLVRRGADAQRSAAGARPAGLGGLETSEVTLRGTLQSRDGWVAMLQGADGKTYIVRAGDRLLDGSVRAIMPDAIVILQQVNDPLSLDKQREVRKTIRQADEAR
jgi:type IV pilus assembly protein PilP